MISALGYPNDPVMGCVGDEGVLVAVKKDQLIMSKSIVPDLRSTSNGQIAQ